MLNSRTIDSVEVQKEGQNSIDDESLRIKVLPNPHFLANFIRQALKLKLELSGSKFTLQALYHALTGAKRWSQSSRETSMHFSVHGYRSTECLTCECGSQHFSSHLKYEYASSSVILRDKLKIHGKKYKGPNLSLHPPPTNRISIEAFGNQRKFESPVNATNDNNNIFII